MRGDLQVCSPRHHCVLFGDGDSDSDDWLSTLSFPRLIHDPSLITPSSKWVTSENTISDILRRIQPTCVAHHKRKNVINFVQGLITTHIGCQVFPYGSVPFKTFLPDGDIDLTALCSSNIENALVSDVHALLTAQQTNGVTPYQVKDVHCIDAEVKLVKCIVQDIVVDISFNQLGGLCTLCFLEQVDRLVGKDHLFKRSIILIKAWCYYESRILGAHHGLISTYALEILVLYIFHLFHTSLHGPFAVLHRFLEYFSKFDWENYCISLHGPVSKSSLPDIVAEVPEIAGHELLLSKDFLRNCMDMFSVSSKGTGPSLRVFTLKHLNIIDPLKENNNLGRSVNRGNFYRICSAFKYGARKLGWILLLPEERIEGELNKFFANTLDRHCWTNEPFPSLDAHFGVSVHSSAPLETCYKDKVCLESSLDIRDENISRTQVSFSNISSTGCHLTETVQKLETAVILNKNTSSTINTPDFSSIHTNQIDVVSENTYSAPQNGFLGLLGSQKIDNWNASCEMTTQNVHNVEIDLTSEVEPKDKLVASNLNCLYSDNKISSESSRSSFHGSENVSSGIIGKCNEGTGRFDDVAKLLDLCGDYDSYIRNLKYGRICDKYVMSPTLPLSPPMLLHVQKNYPWQDIHRSLVRNHKIPSGIDRKGFSVEPQSDPVNRFDIVSEEKKKPQGIGTYFPRTNTRSYRDRQFQAKGRTQGHVSPTQSQRHDCGNELSATPQLLSIYAEDGHEFSEAEFPVLGNGKLKTSDSPPSSYFSKWRFPHGNGISWPFDEELESWPIHPEPSGAVSPETSNPSKQDTLHLSGSSSRIGLSATDIPSQVAENSEERVTEQSFHLKNNEEFPPLSR